MRKNVTIPIIAGLLNGLALLFYLLISRNTSSFIPYLIAGIIYILFVVFLIINKKYKTKELLVALVIGLFIVFCIYLFFNLDTVSLFFKNNLGKTWGIVVLVIIGILMAIFTTRYL